MAPRFKVTTGSSNQLLSLKFDHQNLPYQNKKKPEKISSKAKKTDHILKIRLNQIPEDGQGDGMFVFLAQRQHNDKEQVTLRRIRVRLLHVAQQGLETRGIDRKVKV